MGSKVGEPAPCFAFFCEEKQREYYYLPDTKESTWVKPRRARISDTRCQSRSLSVSDAVAFYVEHASENGRRFRRRWRRLVLLSLVVVVLMVICYVNGIGLNDLCRQISRYFDGSAKSCRDMDTPFSWRNQSRTRDFTESKEESPKPHYEELNDENPEYPVSYETDEQANPTETAPSKADIPYISPSEARTEDIPHAKDTGSRIIEDREIIEDTMRIPSRWDAGDEILARVRDQASAFGAFPTSAGEEEHDERLPARTKSTEIVPIYGMTLDRRIVCKIPLAYVFRKHCRVDRSATANIEELINEL